jgi:thiamine pyrophosphokinase
MLVSLAKMCTNKKKTPCIKGDFRVCADGGANRLYDYLGAEEQRILYVSQSFLTKKHTSRLISNFFLFYLGTGFGGRRF